MKILIKVKLNEKKQRILKIPGGWGIFTLSLKSAEALTLRGLYLRSSNFSGATLYPV